MTSGKVLLQAKNCQCEFEISMDLYENNESMQLNQTLKKKISIVRLCTMHEMTIRNNLLKEARKDMGNESPTFETLRTYLSDLSNEVQ